MEAIRVRSTRISACVCLVVISAVLTVNRAAAQQASALLTGTVKDPSGAVVVDAEITLKNSNTNVARTTTSNKDGDYLFTLVPIGTYELTVEQQGFNKYVQKGITLEVNQNAKVDVAL